HSFDTRRTSDLPKGPNPVRPKIAGPAADRKIDFAPLHTVNVAPGNIPAPKRVSHLLDRAFKCRNGRVGFSETPRRCRRFARRPRPAKPLARPHRVLIKIPPCREQNLAADS